MQTPYDVGLVIRAVEFAAQKHRMQRRKDSDSSPYINHPIALMHVLCIDGGITEPVILAAAALHDYRGYRDYRTGAADDVWR
jgi:GTP diphosphokinase / guanosine-3',5'-bis(diphosphate) 3'-diphosphatase